MVMTFVLGDCALLGVQVNTPLELFRLTPVGAPAPRVKVRMLAGKSTSVALLVSVIGVSSLMVQTVLFRLFRTGATFTSLTVIVKLWVALREGTPLSNTRMVTT